MTSEPTKQDYETARKVAMDLRSELAAIGKKKEFWFERKEQLKGDIKKTIAELKKLQGERDGVQQGLQKIKGERDKYNKEVQRVIAELKKINEQKKKMFSNFQGRVNPASVAEKIDKLEERVEIETDFKKEQKLMEQIKKLKKSHNEMKGLRELQEKGSSLTKELKELKKKADDFHKQVQDMAKDSSYAKFMQLSKHITSLKKTQEDAFAEFVNHKNLYQEKYKAYKSQLKELKELQEKLGIEHKPKPRPKESARKKEEKEQKRALAKKTQEVEEKIKKGGKLTTEDLIAFQGKGA